MDILMVCKLLFSMDVFINLFLCYLIITNKSDGYYYSSKLARAPKLIMMGTLIHVICYYGVGMGLGNYLPSSLGNVVLVPYLLLALYILCTGRRMLRWKAYKSAACLMAHGLLSAGLFIYACIR